MTSKPRAQVQDMTVGNPVRLILMFAVPLFIGNIFQQVYSMVDTMVVGYHLGDSAIAAIGATSSLSALIIHLASSINSGYSIVVTQRFGAHKQTELKQSIAGMILLDCAMAVVLSVLSLCSLNPVMRFLNTPEDIFQQAYLYIAIIAGGILATVGYNMFSSILRAMGNSRSPLYFLIFASILNVVLDILFVVTLGWGIGGAAAATVLAQAMSAIACGIYTFRNYREYLPGKEDFLVPKSLLRELFSMGISLALMSCLVDLGTVIFQRSNNVLGEAIITAHTAARKILSIMIQPQHTIALAASTFIGQNWGAKNPERIQSALRKTLFMELIWGITATTLIYLFGRQLIRLTTGTEDSFILDNAVLSLRAHFAAFPILGVLFCIRNALQSMGETRVPVLSSCIELCMKIFSAFLLIPRLGFFGACITEPVTWCLMVLYMMYFYLSRRKKLFASLYPQ